MKPTHIAIVANGDLEAGERLLPRIQSYSYLVAVDGGLNHCHRLGLTPDVIVGDMDSAHAQVVEGFRDIERIVLPVDKDKSDLEEALERVYHEGCQEITVFGGTGGRLDHTLANVFLLSRYPGVLYFETEGELIFCIKEREALDCFVGQCLSLLPINGAVTGVTTQGLKWELQGARLDKHFISLSNEAVSESVVIEVGGGDLLCTVHIHKETLNNCYVADSSRNPC